ncbi:MAG: benzoate-CoA ligase family protein [Chloroflexi bacterium]|nr:benzoate-CoA ligase family protein [Chloroflexota bacterium]
MDVTIDFDIPETFNMATVLVDRHVAEGRGDRTAIHYGDESITYRGLQRRVNRSGNVLRDHGIGIEDRVILLMADRPQFVEAYVGTMKIGAVPVPVNTMSTVEDMAYYINDSGAAAVIVDPELEPRITQARVEARHLKRVFVVGDAAGDDPLPSVRGTRHAFDAAVAEASDALEAEPTHRDAPSYWLYSSGTTGQPKGTVHLHRDMVSCTGTWLTHVSKPTATDINYSASKLPFSYGLVNGLYQPLLAGIATVLSPEPSGPQIVAATIQRYRPTTFFSVPTLYNLLLRQVEAGDLDLDLSSVRLCISAGEALPAAIYERWLKTFGIEILDGIGSTEFGYIYIQNLPGRARPGSSGQVLPGYRAKVLDEDEQPVPDGEAGELYMQSESFAASYWRKRDRSRETFRGPWLKTGDRYWRDADGYYYYAGRGDDMFKTSGQWVSPVEVEGVLLLHEAVAEAAVVGSTDADGLMKPKAYVVLRSGSGEVPGLAAVLQEHCKQCLAPDYYKYPRWIEFVGEIPKTATGKIQRYKLRVEA